MRNRYNDEGYRYDNEREDRSGGFGGRDRAFSGGDEWRTEGLGGSWERDRWGRPDPQRQDWGRQDYGQGRQFQTGQGYRPESERGDWTMSRDRDRDMGGRQDWSRSEMGNRQDWSRSGGMGTGMGRSMRSEWAGNDFDARFQRGMGGYGYGYERGFGERDEGERGFGERAQGRDEERGEGFGEKMRHLGERIGQAIGVRMGKPPRSYKRSDERIREDIIDRVVDAGLDATEIEVTVKEGEVTLSGSVLQRMYKHRMEDIADQVSGVKDVHNQIKVKREEDTSRVGQLGGTMPSTNDGNRRNSNVNVGRS
jgi:osmotically-inducible protein OsmY